MAIVVLAAAMHPLPKFAKQADGYEIIEYFAGRARITRMARAIGLTAMATDLKYDDSSGDAKSSLNLCTSAGLAKLG